MWRDVTPLFPGVELACGGSSSSLPLAGQLGTGAPADASRAPEFASATSCAAADAPQAGVPHAAVPAQGMQGTPAAARECAVPGCGITAARNRPGYCQPHHDAYLTRAYDLTRDIGRGELP
jgi:hypothetical protein